jgi:hypothetical protein
LDGADVGTRVLCESNALAFALGMKGDPTPTFPYPTSTISEIGSCQVDDKIQSFTFGCLGRGSSEHVSLSEVSCSDYGDDESLKSKAILQPLGISAVVGVSVVSSSTTSFAGDLVGVSILRKRNFLSTIMERLSKSNEHDMKSMDQDSYASDSADNFSINVRAVLPRPESPVACIRLGVDPSSSVFRNDDPGSPVAASHSDSVSSGDKKYQLPPIIPVDFIDLEPPEPSPVKIPKLIKNIDDLVSSHLGDEEAISSGAREFFDNLRSEISVIRSELHDLMNDFAFAKDEIGRVKENITAFDSKIEDLRAIQARELDDCKTSEDGLEVYERKLEEQLHLMSEKYSESLASLLDQIFLSSKWTETEEKLEIALSELQESRALLEREYSEVRALQQTFEEHVAKKNDTESIGSVVSSEQAEQIQMRTSEILKDIQLRIRKERARQKELKAQLKAKQVGHVSDIGIDMGTRPSQEILRERESASQSIQELVPEKNTLENERCISEETRQITGGTLLEIGEIPLVPTIVDRKNHGVLVRREDSFGESPFDESCGKVSPAPCDGIDGCLQLSDDDQVTAKESDYSFSEKKKLAETSPQAMRHDMESQGDQLRDAMSADEETVSCPAATGASLPLSDDEVVIPAIDEALKTSTRIAVVDVAEVRSRPSKSVEQTTRSSSIERDEAMSSVKAEEARKEKEICFAVQTEHAEQGRDGVVESMPSAAEEESHAESCRNAESKEPIEGREKVSKLVDIGSLEATVGETTDVAKKGRKESVDEEGFHDIPKEAEQSTLPEIEPTRTEEEGISLEAGEDEVVLPIQEIIVIIQSNENETMPSESATIPPEQHEIPAQSSLDTEAAVTPDIDDNLSSQTIEIVVPELIEISALEAVEANDSEKRDCQVDIVEKATHSEHEARREVGLCEGMAEVDTIPEAPKQVMCGASATDLPEVPVVEPKSCAEFQAIEREIVLLKDQLRTVVSAVSGWKQELVEEIKAATIYAKASAITDDDEASKQSASGTTTRNLTGNTRCDPTGSDFKKLFVVLGIGLMFCLMVSQRAGRQPPQPKAAIPAPRLESFGPEFCRTTSTREDLGRRSRLRKRLMAVEDASFKDATHDPSVSPHENLSSNLSTVSDTMASTVSVGDTEETLVISETGNSEVASFSARHDEVEDVIPFITSNFENVSATHLEPVLGLHGVANDGIEAGAEKSEFEEDATFEEHVLDVDMNRPIPAPCADDCRHHDSLYSYELNEQPEEEPTPTIVLSPSLAAIHRFTRPIKKGFEARFNESARRGLLDKVRKAVTEELGSNQWV